MIVSPLGAQTPNKLRRAVRDSGNTLSKALDTSTDAIIWSESRQRRLAEQSALLGTPLFYAGIPTDLAKAGGVAEAAQVGSTLFYVPYERRISDPFATLSRQVEIGSVGKTGFIKIHSNQPAPKTLSVGSSKTCDAVVWNSLIHDIDWLNLHFGPIRSVFAQGVSKSRPKLEYVMATFTLKGGVIAQVIHSYQSFGESVVRAEISGTTGIVQYDSSIEAIRQQGSKRGTKTPDIDWAGHWKIFESTLSRKSVPKKTIASYIAPIRIANAVIESIKTGASKKV